MNRIAVRAIEAAFENEQPRKEARRHSGLKAVAAGAALFAAARVAATKAPDMPGVSKLAGSALSRVPDMVRDRLDGLTGQDDELPEDEVPEDELPEDEELDEEPEAGFDDEDEEDEPDDGEPEDEEPPEGPEAGAEEELPEDEELEEDELDDEEPQDADARPEENGNRATPDVMGLVSPHSPPPLLAGAGGRSRRRIRPAARPPAPPRRESDREEA